jgi:hypothetical protein
MDYDLSRLSWRSFEQLIQGIGAEVLGERLILFGDGPDGGREAMIDGQLPFPESADGWSGETVIQAKFLQRPQGTTEDGAWALQKLREELALYTNPESERELPDNLIFATNATCSPYPNGAKDQILALAADSDLHGFELWDYDKLRTYLDRFSELRKAFAAYILPGDVLAAMIEFLDSIKESAPDFDDAMARFLQKELLADQFVNLEQAGRSAEEQIPVSRVFVDLPVFGQRQSDPPEESAEDLSPGLVTEVIAAASHRLDPRSLHDSRRAQDDEDAEVATPEGRIVLVGGPGQGKSTIGQFVCQMFRASLLASRPPESLAPEVTDALGSLQEHCAGDSLELPAVRRFPLRIELSKFADQLGGPEPRSLLEFLATQISARIEYEVTPALMSDWLSGYPWLLVLDGLDEVPPSANREALIAAIKDFFIDVHQDNADCLVIATTRPQGYSEEFSQRHYRHLWLAPLSAPRALHYANRLLHARFPTDEERRQNIGERLRRASERPDTARLLTSPLQVTIMATLLERMGQPPEGRWNLFSQYYRVIYDRELEREIAAAEVLRDHKPDIDAIHHRVGLLLQVESEGRQVDPRMSREHFAGVVRERLREEGHEEEGDAGLIDQIIDTAMERLVFLVGVEADHVGFEIRSLQEFMAAEALLDADDQIVATRLRQIAALPAWRNVFLFAAGRCFTDRQHLRDTIHTICVETNDSTNDHLAALALPGSDLAIDLLDDGVANNQPRYERLLAREGLRILRLAPNPAHEHLAEIYKDPLRHTYEEALAESLRAEGFSDRLGSLITLAILRARGIEWAGEMFANHFESGELRDLIAALPERARSAWLAELLAEACAKRDPDFSITLESKLRELGVLEAAPTWFSALVGLYIIEHRPPPMRFAVEGTKMTFTLRAVSDIWPPLAQGSEELAADGEDPPEVWGPYVSLLDFAIDPCPESLAVALEAFSQAEDPNSVIRHGRITSWPLAALLIGASGSDQLAEWAHAAREGRFGNRDDWIAAEQRWADGVSFADLSATAEGGLPFDVTIRERGFPLGVAGITGADDWQPATRVLLQALENIEDRSIRRYLAGAVFWLLAYFAQPSTSPIEVSEILAAIRPIDFEDSNGVHLESLSTISWNDPLTTPEVELLEGIGAAQPPQRGLPVPSLSAAILELLVAVWRKQPNAGIYRLIAISMPPGELTDAGDEDLLNPEDSDPAARATLRLKLGAGLEDADLAALAESEHHTWLSIAIDVLGGVDLDLAAQVTARLYELLPNWQQRREMVHFAPELIARRSSGLAKDDTWRKLGLFKRPGQ